MHFSSMKCSALLVLASIALAAHAAGKPSAQLLVRGANGQVEIVDAAHGKRQAVLNLRCDRIHSGAGSLACLRTVPGQGLKLDLADRVGKVHTTLNFPNVLLASRVRVARDGTLAAFTGFSAGHSYASTDFSTRTYLIDPVRKRTLADVSTFKVIGSDKLALPSRRYNVWGISFDPRAANRFMATIGAGGEVFLAQGDVRAKTLTLLRADMECPSFSPDGSRLAFKRRKPGGGWLPAVYDLASGREWVMREARSVDDQIEWVDEATIAYELPRAVDASGDALAGAGTDLVLRRADGSGVSRVLVPLGGSPSVINR